MPTWPSSPAIHEITPLKYTETRVEKMTDKGYWFARNYYHKPLRKFTITYIALTPSEKNVIVNFINSLRGEATDFQITVPHGHTITNVTNTTPIVITVQNYHEFMNGDAVIISGVEGNTAANGAWYIANVTATTFELVTSVGNGTFADANGDAIVNLVLPSAKIVYNQEEFVGTEKILGPDVNASGYFTLTCDIEELYPRIPVVIDEGSSSFLNWYPSFEDDLVTNAIVYYFVEYEDELYATSLDIDTFRGELLRLGSWDVFRDFGVNGLWIAAPTVYDGELYLVETTNASPDSMRVWSYHNGTDTWTTQHEFSVTDMVSYGGNIAIRGIVFNNMYYFGTTATTGGGKFSIFQWNAATSTMTVSHTFTSPPLLQEAVLNFAVYNSELYAAVSGLGSNYTGKIYKFNGSTWSLHHTFATNTPLTNIHSFNGKLYAIVIGDGNDEIGRLWEYNGSTWSLSVQFPYQTEITNSAMTIYDNKLCILLENFDMGAVVWFFDGTTFTMSKEFGLDPEYSYAFARDISPFSVTNRLYASIGDYFDEYSTFRPIWCYPTPDDNTIPETVYPAEVVPASGYWQESFKFGESKQFFPFNGGNGALYAVSSNSDSDATIWKFNDVTGWFLLHTFDSTTFQARFAIDFNGLLYVGVHRNTVVDKVYTYDGVSWVDVFSFPSTNLDCIYSAKVYNNKLYIGSVTSSASQPLRVYVENGGTFVSSTTFDYKNRVVLNLVTYNSKLYANIGRRIYEFNDTTWSLNFDPNDPLIDPPEDVSEVNIHLIHALSDEFNGKLYAFLWMSYNSIQSNGYLQFWEHNGTTWVYNSSIVLPITRLMDDRFRLTATAHFVEHNSTLFFVLNCDAPDSSQVWKFDGTDTWTLEQYLHFTYCHNPTYYEGNDHVYIGTTAGTMMVYPDLNEF